MLRYVIALVLVAHGIGHSIGIMQSLRIATINPEWNGDSWLITGFAGTSVTQAVGVVVWTVALIGFVLAAAVVVGWLPETWWAPLAVGSSLLVACRTAAVPGRLPDDEHAWRPRCRHGRARRGPVGRLGTERSSGLSAIRWDTAAGARAMPDRPTIDAQFVDLSAQPTAAVRVRRPMSTVDVGALMDDAMSRLAERLGRPARRRSVLRMPATTRGAASWRTSRSASRLPRRSTG